MAAPAQAVVGNDGTVSSFVLDVVQDGVQVPNDLDSAEDNGSVATNDAVVMSWTLNTSRVGDGVIVQELPAGWEWDVESLDTVLNSDIPEYQVSYELSPDGRTLTARFNDKQIDVNPKLTVLSGIRAIPTSAVANNSTYTPRATITVNGSETVATHDPVTVLSEPTYDLYKNTRANNMAGRFDFGAGEVEARYLDFRVGVESSNLLIGDNGNLLAQPFTIADSFTVTQGGSPVAFSGAFVPQVIGTSESGATPTVTAPGAGSTSFEVVLDGYSNVKGAWVDIRMWYPTADAPITSEGAYVVRNSVSAPTAADTENNPAREVDPSDNTSEGRIVAPPPAGTPGNVGLWGHGKKIYAFKGSVERPEELLFDPESLPNMFDYVNESIVQPGTVVMSRMHMRPGNYIETNIAAGARDLRVYDFWDPAQQQIVSDTKAYVGEANSTGGAVDPSTYLIEYTNGSDTSEAQAGGNQWFSTIDAAGGPTQVTGARVTYLGTWGALTPEDDAYFIVAIPLRVVAETGADVPDQAVWRWVDVNDNTQSARNEEFITVGQHRLGVSKDVDRRSITSGNPLNYEIHPRVLRAYGSDEDVMVSGIEVRDYLTGDIADLDLNSVEAPWEVASLETNEVGIQILFRYQGTIMTGEALPPIRYTLTTSALAEQDTLRNLAVVSSDRNAQRESTRSASTATTVVQAQIVSEEKRVLGESVLDVSAEEVTWETSWFNFVTGSQGESYFTDLLPYNDDDNGSHFSGTAVLKEATLLDVDGNPAPASYGKLQYTIADRQSVFDAGGNPNDGLTWVDADQFPAAELDQVTAVRALVNDFVNGQAGIGRMQITLSIDGQSDGDEYINTSSGWLGADGRLGLTNKAGARVVGASVAGIVWNDQNGDGVIDEGEPRLANVTVGLFNSAGEQVGLGVPTRADGSYEFRDLPAGEYSTRVTFSSVRFLPHEVVIHTFDHDGTLDNDSGLFTLEKGEPYGTSLDFGYRAIASDISLDKSGRLAGEGRAGEWVDWSFVITNIGGNRLTQVELTDHLDGVIDLEITWPGEAGVLEADQEAPATARYQLTQADMDRGYVLNTATVEARDPNNTLVDDPAEAQVTLPEGGSLLLKKTGQLQSEVAVDGIIEWTFVLENTGNVTLTDLELTDELAGLGEVSWGTWPGEPFTLASGEEITGVATSKLTQQQIDDGCVLNVARAAGTTPGDMTAPSNEADAEVCFETRPALTLVKKADREQYSKVGEVINYTFTVENTGNVSLHDPKVTETEFTGVQEFLTEPKCPATPNPLLPGQTIECTASYTVQAADLNRDSINNTAIAEGTPPGPGTPIETPPDTARVVPNIPPGIPGTPGTHRGLVITGGAEIWPLVGGIAGTLVLAGALLLWVRSKKSPALPSPTQEED